MDRRVVIVTEGSPQVAYFHVAEIALS